MLTLELFVFTYPGIDGECINQTNKGFNVTVKADLQQIRLTFMMQCILRIIDYLFVQVLNLLVKSQQSGKSSKEFDPLAKIEDEVEAIPFLNNIPGKDDFWNKLDLKQSPYIPGLDVKIKSPLVVIPDLGTNFGSYNKRFELDLGTVVITTQPIDKEGRWIHFPKKKLKMMQVTIENTDLKFDFIDRVGKRQTIFSENKIDLVIQIPNFSPFFVKEDSADYQGPHIVDKQGNMFDPAFVDTSISVKVTQRFFRVIFLQEVLKNLFDLLDNNITRQDEFSAHFTRSINNKRVVTQSR